MSGEILVAGIGNIFRGDDGFGVEVVRRFASRGARDGVRAVDFGIRGFDLAYALSAKPRAAILVDATTRGGAPGTLYVLEPSELAREASIDTHAMHPMRALELANLLGGVPEVMRVVACEAKSVGSDDDVPAIGLSVEVEAAVDRAIALVDEMLAELAGARDA